MARTVEHHDDNVLDALFDRARNNRESFGDGAIHAQGIAAFLHVANDPRSVGELRHVKGGNVPESNLDPVLRAGGRDTTNGVRRSFRNVRCAINRVDRDIELRRTRKPRAELFAFKNSRRVVLDSFADDDFAADVHQVEHAAHGVAGGGVGFFLFAAAEPAQRVQRSRFSRPDKVELNDALDVGIILFWQARHGEALRLAHGPANDKRASNVAAVSDPGFITERDLGARVLPDS